jgi:hypothetical protein
MLDVVELGQDPVEAVIGKHERVAPERRTSRIPGFSRM